MLNRKNKVFKFFFCFQEAVGLEINVNSVWILEKQLLF